MRFSLAIQRIDGHVVGRARHVFGPPPANDNLAVLDEAAIDRSRICSELYGDHAMAHAQSCAKRAFFLNDMRRYRWWLDVIRSLDMAIVTASR